MRLTDDFAGTFVKGDNDVLAHLTLVSGLCLRSSNLGKLLILLLAFSFTYAVSTAFPFMYGADTNTRFMAAEIAILDVVTDPGDQHLATRKWRMTRFGPLFGAIFNIISC